MGEDKKQKPDEGVGGAFEEKQPPSQEEATHSKEENTAPAVTESSSTPAPSSAEASTESVTESTKKSPKASKAHDDMLAILGERALRAGSKGKLTKMKGGKASSSVSKFSKASGGIAAFQNPANGLANNSDKYLVVGDNIMGPFMALCLKLNGLDCDLAQHMSNSDADKGVIVLTPSITQVMGDALNVNVPSGSVVGRILTFDHVGNDMCDIDLNEFREQGESPTFFSCDRPKIEASLMSLCRIGQHACTVLQKPNIDKGGLQALPGGGVRVTFSSGVTQDYAGVISTVRNQSLVPELLENTEELKWRDENEQQFKKMQSGAARWIEVCVPPLPELDGHTKRFTPGSQEVIELITPRDSKMCVRPTMMATKLFYNVSMTIPDSVADPRLKSTSMKQFWDDVIESWTAGIPGYISHTMFRPLFTHMQQHFVKSSALVYKTPIFLMPHWLEGDGRVIKICHSAHGSCFDAIDVSDAQGFTDCFITARALAAKDDMKKVLEDRRLQVMEEMDNHAILAEYALKERGQWAYMTSRVGMKLMRRYKKSWRRILKNYVTMLPR